MHGSQGVLKTAVLRSWEDPACALQLTDIAQTLHPGRVNQILLSDLTGPSRTFHRDSKWNVLMDRIRKERQPLIVLFCHLCNHVWHWLNPALGPSVGSPDQYSPRSGPAP